MVAQISEDIRQAISNNYVGWNRSYRKYCERKKPQDTDLLYFGSHAEINGDDPMRFRILLAKNMGEQIERWIFICT